MSSNKKLVAFISAIPAHIRVSTRSCILFDLLQSIKSYIILQSETLCQGDSLVYEAVDRMITFNSLNNKDRIKLFYF